jgi:hypothetical protein
MMYFKQDCMLYFPEKEIWQSPRDVNLEYEEIYFKTKDGITISGWYIPSEKVNAPFTPGRSWTTTATFSSGVESRG